MNSPTPASALTPSPRLWERQGAQVRRADDGTLLGTSFALWAPHARRVQVKGDFNGWTGDQGEMTRNADGVWETELPTAAPGQRYMFAVESAYGGWSDRADPLARAAEIPPATASVIAESAYSWGDEAWLNSRSQASAVNEPMSTYEVHLGSWRRGLSYRDLATQLVPYVADLGFTHVEFMPVMQHPFGGSWGYHVTGYYAPDARLGSPDDLKFLIDAFHQAGIGVILDWVPGHFATDEWALARFDGTALYEHPDPRRGFHTEWGSHIFDFGRPEVREFLISNALYWAGEFHADGLRVDGVASMLYLDYARADGEWEPNIYGGHQNLEAVGLLQELNTRLYADVPGVVVIAEESTAWPGVTAPADHDGLGFGFKWNMGWMHDSLNYFGRDPIYRSWHQGDITHSTSYAWSENYILPLSHDEVVHGKGSLVTRMPGSLEDQLSGLASLLAYQWAHPGKQLLFMGGEFGQVTEWAESGELAWDLIATADESRHTAHPGHRGLRDAVAELNRVYRAHPALWARDNEPGGFQWLETEDAEYSVLAFARHGGEETVAVLCNFSGVDVRRPVRLPEGTWSTIYSSSHRDAGARADRFEHTDEIHLPRLSVTWLRRVER